MKKILLILIAVMVALGAEARTVRDFFASEPGQVFMLLPKTTRLDLLDYYDNDQLVYAKNNMGMGTKLVKVEDNFINIRMSDSKTVQMLLVPAKKDSVIAVIETVETPVADSRISFYDTNWNPLPGIKHFAMPTMESFVLKTVDKAKREQLLQDIVFPLISLNFEGDDHTTLVARHGLKEFLVKDEYKPYESSLAESLSYSLKGTKWKLNK